jgi:WhiB family redox-sensing transcriptional regulator
VNVTLRPALTASGTEVGHRALMIVLFGRSGRQPGWREYAPCADTDPELFTNRGSIDAAKAVCAGCPVIAQCRADQLAWEAVKPERRYYPIGVVGGLSAIERKTIHDPKAGRIPTDRAA